MKTLVIVAVLSAGLLGAQTAASRSVPFRATIDTVVTFNDPMCGPICLVEIGGAGQALHLGSTTIDGPSQINFATFSQSGTSTLTAADGSTLTIEFGGRFMPTQVGFEFFGEWTVLSGAGRFDGASGGGTYTGSATLQSGVLNLEGRLTNPGRD